MDDPAGRSFAPPAFYEREARIWLEQSYVLPHGYFIAKHGDEYVGVTDLNLRDALPHGVSFGFTGVKREYRRRGIAKALMVSAIEWAKNQNFETIRALTPANQSPLLELHQALGFTQLFSYVTVEKCLREVASIDPKLYDDYAGCYQDAEKRPGLIFTVRNEGGCLTGEFVGQKVKLFPASERKFFCTPFYGEFTFVTDSEGNVTHLEVRERGRDNAESSLHARRID
jgi:GNAT superfamily N-acetyltransferase